MHILMLLDHGFVDPRTRKKVAALAAAGMHPSVIAWEWQGGRPRSEQGNGYTVVRLGPLSARNKGLRQLGPFTRFAAQAIAHAMLQPCDVVYALNLPLLPVGIAIASVRRRPLLYDAAELYWLMEYRKYSRWIADTIRRVEIELLRWVHTVITVSPLLAPHFRRFHGHVVIVPNWYQSALAAREQLRSDTRRALGVSEDAFCVGALGTLAPERRVDTLIEATSLVPDMHALIAGKGSDTVRLVQLAARHPRAHMLGWRDDPTALYAACDALYYGIEPEHPYHRYSSPNTLFLALAHGIPLLTTPIGEGGSVVRERGCGLLLDPLTPQTVAAAVQHLQQPEIYATFSERARGLHAEYSWQNASVQLVQAVRGAARGSSGSPD
jgi:glycosyltransferase involved in cell wall biosynthesis